MGRHGHGMTVLALELCFSHVLRSDCIFCIHINTRWIVLQHCVHSCRCGRGNPTAGEVPHTGGFAGRPNREMFSHRQRVWTVWEISFSDKDITEKVPCFAQGTRFKYTFYFKCIFQFTSGSISPVSLSVHARLPDLCNIWDSSVAQKGFPIASG